MPTTKHVRLSIDFHVTIADTPPLLPEGMIEPPDPEYDSRQARLLEAVKGNTAVLSKWMCDRICSYLQEHHWGYWEEALMGGDIPFQDILVPVLETLSAEDRDYLKELIELDVFEENIDMFMQSFTIKADRFNKLH